MISIKEIKPTYFKTHFPIDRASFQWHNKNKSGGNFGYNLIYPELNERGFKKTLMLSGYYDIKGNIYNLRLSEGFTAGFNLPVWSLKDLTTLTSYIKTFLAWKEGKGTSPIINETELLTIKEQLSIIGF